MAMSARAPVGVISKVFRILDAIQGAPSGLVLKQISEVTAINKSTAYRFLKHMEREGYLIHTESGAYLIGPKLSQMGTQNNNHAALQTGARTILWELWKSTQETVNLGVLDRSTVLYIDVIESPHEFRLSSRVGIRRPLHATALGKALCAYLPDEMLQRTLDGIVFQSLTPNTIMNLVQFRRELDRVRQEGYALDDEETTLGARCVSVPIFGNRHEPVAAISVSGPVTRVGRDQLPSLSAAVIEASRKISAAMGFPQTTTLDERSTKLVQPVLSSHA
ncbi:MAG TPA: IclR family transcriptional regulator [Candidatus Dormibacteraeota bacterium]|nr:IclR family transcriptional regulator [Candidatus Dormibacteraeota bacterium]